MSRLLSKVGDEVRRHAPTGSGDLRRARQRARLVFASENARRPAVRRRVVLGGVAALAAAAALVVGWQALRQPETLTCYSAEGAPVAAHTWIEAAPIRPERLRFSDDSRVELQGDSRARLTSIGDAAVSLALEKGGLRASIVSAPERRWHFVAGPYLVLVTGTVLGVAWEPDARRFVVEVETGTVEVTGGELRERTVEVVGGERLVVSRDEAGEESIRLRPVDGEESAAGSIDAFTPGISEEASSVDETETTERSLADREDFTDAEDFADAEDYADEIAPSRRSSPPARMGGGIGRLHHHLRARRRQQAVRAAERVGITAAAESLSASRIAQLAEYLRLEGRPDEAERILLRLRTRYPADREARRAAFVLGRLALDHTKYDEARRWFRTVLREAPGSSFAEEAFGRLIDTELRAGHAAAARTAATEYLSRYPDGSYRRVAEQLLRRSLSE